MCNIYIYICVCVCVCVCACVSYNGIHDLYRSPFLVKIAKSTL
jgi:hypothetical protein